MVPHKLTTPPPHLDTHPDPRVTPLELRRVAVSSWLGSSLEYMDFTLYTLAAALVFGPLFFPNESPAVALLASLGAYGSGFVIRPLGGVVFGRIGDRYGRKIVLIATLAMMGVATMGIGLLPTYAQIGMWAPALLVLMRLIQGFGAGAELSGASLLLVESAPNRRRGFYGSIVALGTNSGIFLATVLWLSLSQLPDDAFMSWGWRLPFLFSIVTTLLALYLRTSIKESPVFEEAKQRREAQHAAGQAQRENVWADAAKAKKPFLVALAIRLGENGSVYLVKGFLVGWTVTSVGMDASVATTGVMLGSVLGFITVPLVGLLSDKFGRRLTYIWIAWFQFAFTIPAMFLIQSQEPVLVALVFVIYVGGPVPNLYCVESAWLVEMFGSKHRYTFMTTLKEVGSVLSGGLGPVAAAAIVALMGPGWVPVAAILMTYAAIGIIGGYFAPETRGRDLTSEHDAC